MLKKLAFLLCLLCFSCGSYNSIDSFYDAHKNDDHVTAIRVPQFLLSMISESSPEMKSLVGQTKDLRFMSFPSATPSQTKFLNNQMNVITGNSFIEVFRNNNELKRHVVSIRERKNTVKEILIYNNNNKNGSFIYFNGNFDPVKVKELAQKSRFEKLDENLIQHFNVQTPGITTE